jgi:hypothetical protein
MMLRSFKLKIKRGESIMIHATELIILYNFVLGQVKYVWFCKYVTLKENI